MRIKKIVVSERLTKHWHIHSFKNRKKNTISSILGLQELCLISQVQKFTMCVVQRQHSQRKSVTHQAEHSLYIRPTVSISITDFGKVDPKSSEHWYFLGLRLLCLPLPFLISVLNCNVPAWEEEDCVYTPLCPSCTKNLLTLQFFQMTITASLGNPRTEKLLLESENMANFCVFPRKICPSLYQTNLICVDLPCTQPNCHTCTCHM